MAVGLRLHAEPQGSNRRLRYWERRLIVSAEGVEERPADACTTRGNPAVRALLDHLAEELASEFIELMRASTAMAKDPNPEKEER
jgi:hypothetical protein